MKTLSSKIPKEGTTKLSRVGYFTVIPLRTELFFELPSRCREYSATLRLSPGGGPLDPLAWPAPKLWTARSPDWFPDFEQRSVKNVGAAAALPGQCVSEN